MIGTIERPPSVETPRHQTLMLMEEHYLGPDGIPVGHVTHQTIRALVDGLDHLPYSFDTDQVEVKALQGGTERAMYRTEVTGEPLWTVPIYFSRPLRRGERRRLKYRTRFRYDSPPPPDFRRGVTGRLEGLDIHVHFHQRHLPRQVWWTQWEHWDQDSAIISEEPVLLEDGAVHRNLRYVERAAIGFRWEWIDI